MLCNSPDRFDADMAQKDDGGAAPASIEDAISVATTSLKDAPAIAAALQAEGIDGMEDAGEPAVTTLAPTKAPTKVPTSAPGGDGDGNGNGGGGGGGSSPSSGGSSVGSGGDKGKKKSDGLSTGAIAGIAIGCLLIFGIAAVVAIKHKNAKVPYSRHELDSKESVEMVQRQPSKATMDVGARPGGETPEFRDNPMVDESARASRELDSQTSDLKRSTTVVSMT